MDVRKLAPGHAAPEGSDHIRLVPTDNGKIELTASIGGHARTSLVLGTYDSTLDAQRAGLNWVVGRGVGLLYIEIPFGEPN